MKHKFVEFIPSNIENDTLYISIEYTTATHSCCCGCGNEVVTPLSPTDWKLIFNGETVSLNPSIGNWGFACRSHYFIRNNTVEWAGNWNKSQIESGRKADCIRKQNHFKEKNQPKYSFWSSIFNLFRPKK